VEEYLLEEEDERGKLRVEGAEVLNEERGLQPVVHAAWKGEGGRREEIGGENEARNGLKDGREGGREGGLTRLVREVGVERRDIERDVNFNDGRII